MVEFLPLDFHYPYPKDFKWLGIQDKEREINGKKIISSISYVSFGMLQVQKEMLSLLRAFFLSNP
jgi:hypothetical protein